MNLVAKGKFIILTLIEKDASVKSKSGIITITEDTESSKYRIHHSGKSETLCKGDIVVLNGYAQPIEIDGMKYFIINEDGIAAVIE